MKNTIMRQAVQLWCRLNITHSTIRKKKTTYLFYLVRKHADFANVVPSTSNIPPHYTSTSFIKQRGNGVTLRITHHHLIVTFSHSFCLGEYNGQFPLGNAWYTQIHMYITAVTTDTSKFCLNNHHRSVGGFLWCASCHA